MRTAKTLIRLGGCPGSPESSLGTHAILLVVMRRIIMEILLQIMVCHGNHEIPFQVLGNPGRGFKFSIHKPGFKV